eukprot:TRINITY_DN1460_c0_g1_i1.p1 TRINITY_DN1460_c0_g1~~TRINITY_DN1460_c0_g1_i1.p1  ORF type:complete len:294 (-),score=55.10 TRINITY_DN1460_c0_g1_i1:126-908(-)
MAYTFKETGAPETTDFRVFFFKDGKPVSPFHDIPLWADQSKGIANMVVEIPKGTQPKMEISKSDFLNPIKQDTKNGKLRIVALPYPFNYGAFPQTWENPAVTHPDTQAKGDNDPVDVVDLSSSVATRGQVKRVKVLGTYAMIDEGETDWKILVIDENDPVADKVNDLADIETHLPGRLKEAFEFLRDYKIPDGKPANKFAYDNAPRDKAFALNIIHETYEEWKQAANGAEAPKGIVVANTTLGNAASVSFDDAAAKIPAQ